MGHLVIISDYVIAALEKLPLELKATVRSHSPQQEWDNFVHGKFQDIKKREATLLGGTRPMRSMAMPNGIGDIRWSKMDEDDSSKVPIVAPPTLKGTFRRAESLSSFSRSTVTAFAPAPATQSEPSTSHVRRTQESGTGGS
jgi:serine/threonine-protein phosphatase 6 regulatory subunit 3